MTTIADRRAAFRALHQSGCFTLPNPWDAGSAKVLASLGFQALASTSTGFAWSHGRADYQVTLEQVLAHLRELVHAVELPINADFESGFAREPADVAANVRRAVDVGVAGLSIEDRDVDTGGLYEQALAIERIRAAKAASADAILVARAEVLLSDPTQTTAAIDRLVAFADAGADCVFAPGVVKPEHIAAMVKAVAPVPVNVVVFKPGLSARQLADLGVRRISVGGSLARVAWQAMIATAKQVYAGSFEGLTGTPSSELNAIFR